ncbi:DMT family transporter [Microbispora sp. H11081]|uniref:DMT family transporter n=1 Tax=Microbispora sp. H11081 TaxID=2729107 RepID=UPI001472A5D8|nr:EamA family transporter [Microbispora sp. H11081]
MRSRSGPLALVGAAVLWGTAGTVGTLATAGSVSLAAARLVLGGTLLGVLALVTQRRARRTGRGSVPVAGAATRWPLAPAVVAVAGYQLCYFAAVGRTGVAIGTVVAMGSGPVFTGFLSWVIGRERPSGRWALATAAAVAGCAVLVTDGSGGADGADAAGIALALLAGLMYAFYAVVAARAIGGGMESGIVMGVLFGGAAVLMLPVLALTGPAWLAHPGGLLTALYLGCATTGLAYLLYGRGLRTTPVATAATLTLAEPAVAALLGVVALHEHLSPVSWAGLVLLALGLVVVALPRRVAHTGRHRIRDTAGAGRRHMASASSAP